MPQVVVAVAVALVLVLVVAAHVMNEWRDRVAFSQTLENARAFHAGVQMMTLDSKQSPPDGYRWTTLYRNNEPAKGTLRGLFRQLLEDGYFTESKLRSVMRAPGKPATSEPLGAEDIAFRIFVVDDNSPANQVMLVTANVDAPRGGMRARTAPFGDRGYVYLTKGGGGEIVRRADAARLADIFPASSGGGDSPRYEVLR